MSKFDNCTSAHSDLALSARECFLMCLKFDNKSIIFIQKYNILKIVGEFYVRVIRREFFSINLMHFIVLEAEKRAPRPAFSKRGGVEGNQSPKANVKQPPKAVARRRRRRLHIGAEGAYSA